MPHHSWNAPQRFTNWALFNGGHHSDHHEAPAAGYERRQAMADAPRLPMGYAGSLFLALFPPLWRRFIEPPLQRWRAVNGYPIAAARSSPPAVPRPDGDRAA